MKLCRCGHPRLCHAHPSPAAPATHMGPCEALVTSPLTLIRGAMGHWCGCPEYRAA